MNKVHQIYTFNMLLRVLELRWGGFVFVLNKHQILLDPRTDLQL